MAVLRAAFREGLFVDGFAGGVEHLGLVAVARDPFASQIGNVVGERGGTEARSLMADHASLDHHAAGIRAQIERGGGTASASEGRDAAALFSAAKSFAAVTGFFGGAHDLADKTFVADASRPDAHLVVAALHEIAPCQTLVL